ncbi:hypothetical protein TrLO_g12782 [Triparma laevis f. longispina]|uniref:Minor capsid protein P9 transmembrane helices domain-containing protein n=1 Tax=Triparma laevis f. longispina TaxID=1714387 RepID=A0A9W6ZL30_9STRA|nr:hypothetical protein TrLO_g12782 [Triparma laevis f. longispina]
MEKHDTPDGGSVSNATPNPPNPTPPTTQFWIHDIKELFPTDFMTKLLPHPEMTSHEKLNAITQIVILMTILGYIITRNTNFLLTGITTIVAVIALNHIQNDRAKTENFEGLATAEAIRVARGRMNDPVHYTQPTPENPAMNVMPADVYDNPTRPPAAQSSNPEIANKMAMAVKDLAVRGRRENNQDKDAKLDPRLYQDMEDERVFDHSMRSFQPTANTEIPNDQGKFADFLYGDMVSCKAGDEVACMRNNLRHTNM